MKETTFALLLSFSCCWLAAQCPTGDITFSMQGQVDSFPVNYPGCSEMDSSMFISGSSIIRLDSLYPLKKIGGQLIISGTVLSDLNGLNHLDSVKGSLNVLGNPVLTSLTGLENLKFVGRYGESFGTDVYTESGLEISNNPVLTALQGLENLKVVEGCLDIVSNPSLVTIAGLGSLSSIRKCEYFGGVASIYRSINISSNPALLTLTGLNNIDSVEADVSVFGNSSLKSLIGLDNIQQIGGGLFLDSNDSLTTLGGLEKLDSLGACLVIENNNSLVTLDAIKHLEWIGVWSSGHPASFKNLNVIGNNQLTSLSGLDSIEIPVPGKIRIYNCPLLAICSVYSICQYFQNGGGNDNIFNNAPGCNSVAEVEAACIVSIEETTDSEPAVIFSPNPASNLLQIQINESEEWGISLYDLQGRQMFRQATFGSQTIWVKDWPSGIYTLRGISGGRVFAGKIIKQ